jgi:hypothetical protein
MKLRDKQGIFIICTLIFISSVILGFAAYQKITTPYFDSSNCKTIGENNPRRKPVPQYVILIDQSEPLSETQKKYTYKFIEDLIFNGLQSGDMISLFTFHKDKYYALEPIICLCKPQAKSNLIYENPRKIREYLEQHFLNPLGQILNEELSKSFGLESPILEAIQSVSRSREIDRNDKGRHMIIISDLLQHTPMYSMYRDEITDFDNFGRSNHKYSSEIQPDLSGWDITIIYLLRNNAKEIQSSNDHIKFWLQYFQKSGATVSKVEKVE